MPRPIRSPDIDELRAFCAAVDLGSLGSAARLFQLSQPALSKRLKSLEAIAGARLLERSSRGVQPTPAGERLYREARRLLTQVDAIEGLMATLSDDETPVRLAASHTIAEFVLPAPLVAFEAGQERHLSVELVIANSRNVRDLVADGRAQLGIAAVDPAAPPTDALEERPLLEDEVVVGVPATHPWAAREEIVLEDFVSTPMITHDPGGNTRRTVEAVLADRELSLASPLAQLGSTNAALEAARMQGAPVLVSALALRRGARDLHECRVEGLRFPRRFVLLMSGGGGLPPPARALAEHLIEQVGDLSRT